MISLSVPVGLLLGPFKEKIEKSFLLQTYATSHREYLKRTGFLNRWRELGAHVEVSMDTPSVLDGDRVPMVSVALRSKSDVIEELSVLVNSHSMGVVYQDVLTYRDVGTTPVVKCSPSLPLRTFVITGPTHIVESLSDIEIKLLSFKSSTLQQSVPAEPVRYRINVIDLLNDRFVYKWGTHWNLAEIDFAVNEYANKIKWHLVSLRHYYPSGARVPLREVVVAVAKHYIGRPIAWILSRKILLRFYFWVPIVLRVRTFSVDRS